SFAHRASEAGDIVLAKMLFSLHEDCVWHGQWSRALVELLIADRPENASVLRQWIARWDSAVWEATRSLAPLFDETPGSARFDRVLGEVRSRIQAHRSPLEPLEAPS